MRLRPSAVTLFIICKHDTKTKMASLSDSMQTFLTKLNIITLMILCKLYQLFLTHHLTIKHDTYLHHYHNQTCLHHYHIQLKRSSHNKYFQYISIKTRSFCVIYMTTSAYQLVQLSYNH